MPENILQSSSEVDFLTPQNVQVSFNEQIYDITMVFNNSKLEINFTNKSNIIGGTNVCITKNDYKITYKDMVFNGEKSQLATSFLPVIIHDFLLSFEDCILLDSYDKDHECFFVKKNIDGYFLTLECYETDAGDFYSLEIK